MAEDPISPIVADIRALFNLQDAAANGHGEALALQQWLLFRIGKQDWRTLPPDDGTAAIIAGYVLSGGQPELAENLAKAKGLEHSAQRLLEGAAHYMRGESGKALENWKSIE